MTAMVPYFVDSSALVKCYFVEDGSKWMSTLLAADAILFISSLTRIEVTSAIARRAPASEVSMMLDQFDLDAAELFNTVSLTDDLVEPAVRLVREYRLRAADALQLAAALVVADEMAELVFISADDTLNAAAEAEELTVENPNAHA